MSLMLFARCRITKTIGRGLYAAATLLWLGVGVAIPSAHAAAGEELLAEKPFIATHLDGMALTKDVKGVAYAVTVPQAINTLFEVVNMKTMQRTILESQRTDGRLTSGRAYAVLSNRHVLVGTTTGFVYDFNPDKMTVTEQTAPQASGLSFQEAVAGDDNTVYFTAAAQTGQRVYAFAAGGASWREVALIPDATAGLAYHKGMLFTGGAAGSGVTVINTANGATSRLSLPSSVPPEASVFVDGVFDAVLYLTLRTTPPQTVAYDLTSSVVLDQRPALGQLSGQPSKPVVTAPAAVTPAADTSAAASTAPVNTSNVTTQTQGQASQTGQTGTNSQPDTAAQSNTGSSSGRSQSQTQNTTTTQPTAETPKQQTTNQSTGSTQTPTSNTPHTSATTIRSVQPAPVVQRERIYYGALGQYDAMAKSTKTYTSQSAYVPVKGNCWLDDTRCVVYTARGGFGVVNTANRSFKLASPSPLVGGAQLAGTIAISPDDTVYAAAAAEGAGVMEMDRDDATRSKVVAPPEGVVTSLSVRAEAAVAGTDKGMLSIYYRQASDGTPPRFDKQVRTGTGSITALAEADKNTVVFAVAVSGAQNGAAIGIFDVKTGAVTMTPQLVVAGQTIMTLVHSRGVVYGGTSAGSLVSYDLTTHKTTVKVVSAHSVQPISGLTIGQGGGLYGVTATTLFAADPQTLAVSSRRSFPASQGQPGSIQSIGANLIASVAGKIYRVTPRDLTTQQIASGTHVVVNSRGDMYYSREGAMYRQVAEKKAAAAGQTTPASSATTGFDLSSFGLKIGAGSAAVGVLLLAIPLVRALQRRPTYSLQR